MMLMKCKLLLRKRSVIEAPIDQLKKIVQAKHSRHRSFGNFIRPLGSEINIVTDEDSFGDKLSSLRINPEI